MSLRLDYLHSSPNPKKGRSFEKMVQKQKHASVSNDGSAFPKVTQSLESFYEMQHLLGEYEFFPAIIFHSFSNHPYLRV